MARPRTANVMLPRDVQKVVKPSGASTTTMHLVVAQRAPASAFLSVAIQVIQNSGACYATSARLRPLAKARSRS